MRRKGILPQKRAAAGRDPFLMEWGWRVIFGPLGMENCF